MKLKYLCLCILILSSVASFGQNKIINVNHATGTANVVIPLYTINSGNVSLPMTLNYSATGIKVNDVEGTAGMGWNLKAGGQIVRQLRGLPDDCSQDISGNSKVGWMNVSSYGNPPYVSPFHIANTGAGTCADEATDVTNFTTYFTPSIDTEPDIFSVEAPGLSCQLVFDQIYQQFRTIPYLDVKISYVMGSNGITSFTITNDKGITYTFSTIEPSFQRATNTANTTPTIFGMAFNQFRGNVTTVPEHYVPYSCPDPNNPGGTMTCYLDVPTSYSYTGGVTFTGAWDLTSINDVYGNIITISYSPGAKKGSAGPVSVFQGAATTATQLYTLTSSTTPNLISQISYGNSSSTKTAFTFVWETNSTTQKSFIKSISGFGRAFQFNYNNIVYTPYIPPGSPANNTNFNRFFLNNVLDPACGTPFNYAFNYCNPTMLADSTSADVDYWGYNNRPNSSGAVNTSLKPDVKINPGNTGYSTYLNPESITYPAGATASGSYGTTYPYEITGSNRQTAPFDGNSSYTPNTVGSLTDIYYGNGGYTSLAYEPNDYYDSLIGGTVLGGGIRVTSITDGELIHANPSSSPASSTTYTYSDPATGYSSGKPVSFPVYAFLTPYTGSATGSTQWISSTVSSYSDLSSEDHTIFYGTVTETMPGTGSIVHQFAVPATYGSAPIASSTVPWQPTAVYVGRATVNGNCPSIGLLSNSVNTYPFPPNPNYDFERGLPLKTISYNYSYNGTTQIANEVSEIDYTYTTPSPATLYAYKWDYNGQSSLLSSVYNYANYIIYASTGPLTTQVYSKVFDLSSTTSAKQTTTNYTYGSAQHQLPTQVSVVNSDGSTLTTNMQYVKDYVIPSSTTAGDNFMAGIQNLQSNNINVVVEKYSQFTPAGTSQTTVTTGGQLVKFGIFTPVGGSGSFGMPIQKLNFSSSNGISNFVPSSVSGTYTFKNDPNYIATENDFGYDYSGSLLSKDNGFGHVQTSIVNHASSQSEAVFDNAKYNEIAFTDFDNYNAATNFTLSTSSSQVAQGISSAPGHVGSALSGAGLGVTFTKSITKSTLTNKYIFSVWINSTGTGSFTISVSGTGSSGPVTNNTSITYNNTTVPATSTGWQYYEVPVSLAGITSSTFTVTAGPTTTIAVDDILFYPDAGEVNTYGYDPTTNFKIAHTNTNGVSTYTSYDQFGRLCYVFDQDKNIVNRNTYAAVSNIQNSIGINSNQALFIDKTFVLPLAFSTTVSGTDSHTITFNNNTFGTPCMPGQSFTWDFGDNSTATSTGNAPVTHTYSSSSTYTVKLSLTYGAPLTLTSKIKIQ